ncbi:unnamed protein product, partial [Ectocarpus sp. 13 AM-2016]
GTCRVKVARTKESSNTVYTRLPPMRQERGENNRRTSRVPDPCGTNVAHKRFLRHTTLAALPLRLTPVPSCIAAAAPTAARSGEKNDPGPLLRDKTKKLAKWPKSS